MSEPISPTPEPEPRYKTVQFRVPVLGRRAAVGTAVGAVLVAGAAFAGITAYHHQAEKARLTQAEAAYAPTAQEVLQRNRAGLGQVEDGIKDLSATLDRDLAAKSSKGVDVNGLAAAQNGLSDRLQKIDGDLGTLEKPQYAILATYKLPADAVLLNDDQRKELSDLRDRRKADAAQVAGLDGQIASVAQHREALAQAEKEAAQAAAAQAAKRERALAAARAMREQAEGPQPSRVVGEEPVDAPPVQTVVYEQGPYYGPYDYPYYGYPYYGRPYYGPAISFGFGFGGRGHGHHR